MKRNSSETKASSESRPRQPRNLGGHQLAVVGVVASVALGIASYFITDRAFALSLIVTLLGSVLALQLEAISRLESKSQREDRYSHLMASLESVPWMAPVIRNIADAACAMSSEDDLRRLLPVARSKVEECSVEMQTLRMGQYRVRAEDVEVLFEQTEAARTIIRATSITHVDLSWWYSDVGRKYWEANRAAMARGVRIERVFVHDKWTPQLEQLADEQQDGGVDVYIVAKDRLADDLRIDLIVWDQVFLYEIELNSDGVEIFNRYSVSQIDIDRRLRQFAVIKAAARRYSTGDVVRPHLVTPATPDPAAAAPDHPG